MSTNTRTNLHFMEALLIRVIQLNALVKTRQ